MIGVTDCYIIDTHHVISLKLSFRQFYQIIEKTHATILWDW